MNSFNVHRSKRLAVAVLTALSLSFASASPALAQNSTSQGYDTAGPRIQGQVEGETQGHTDGKSETPNTPNTVRKADSTGTLPFTGFEASLVLFLGVALAGLGFGLRRVSSRPTA